MKIVEIDMSTDPRIIKLIHLLKYKNLEQYKDYRGRVFAQRFIPSHSRLNSIDFEGSVFYSCGVPLDLRSPSALYIDCFDDIQLFIEERDRLKVDVDFEYFDFSELTGVLINGCVFDGCSLPNTVFSGMNLDSVSFVNCNLAGADFSDAKIANCNFRGADLGGAHLGASFTNCNFYNADLENAEIFGLDADLQQFQDIGYLPEGFIRCDSCSLILEEDDAQNTDEESLCWNCYEEYVCYICGEASSDLDGERICEACRDASEDEDDDESWD